MKGRKALPDNVKALHGEKRMERMRGELIIDKVEKLPAPPRWFGRTAKKYYNSVGIFLLRANIITPVDVGVLEMCSYEFGRYHDLTEELNKIPLSGLTKEQSQDYKRIRIVKNEAKDTWLKLAIELGMTPASRLKFHVQKEEKSELQKFLDDYND